MNLVGLLTARAVIAFGLREVATKAMPDMHKDKGEGATWRMAVVDRVGQLPG